MRHNYSNKLDSVYPFVIQIEYVYNTKILYKTIPSQRCFGSNFYLLFSNVIFRTLTNFDSFRFVHLTEEKLTR